MKAVEIKKGIYWVGAIDWKLRNFHGYLTQNGSTYNAYLIIDEKITLIDTVKHHMYGEMLERISSVIDPTKIDYIISNHTEMDHSGAIPHILNVCKNVQIIASPNGVKGLKKHFHKDWNFKEVKTEDTLNLGKRTLNFVLMPMVHWPDSMAVYIPKEKLLLPNDAFGQHIASSERFDDELATDTVLNEAAKYYANIVLPYGAQVKKVLNEVSKLNIDMIGPSHGIIWRKNINDIIELYGKWADNISQNKAAIIYDTMWGSTEKIAYTINDVFESAGINARLFDLKVNHISDIMTYLLNAKYICVGSPTLNNNMLPTVAAFLTYMKGLAPKNRIGLAFGSYGWGGQSIGDISAILKASGFDLLDDIKVQYIPDAAALNKIKDNLKNIIK